MYQFSQSSVHLLENCIKAAEAANRPELKWIELFKPNNLEKKSLKDVEDNAILPVKSPDHFKEDAEEDRQPIDEKNEHNLNLEVVERIGAILIAAPNKLSLIQQNNYELLLPDLANHLPFDCVQSICEEILKSGIQNERIMLNFFQAFILQDLSNSLNLLLRGYKIYPDMVLAVIKSLFTNTVVPTKLLEEFFIATNVEVHSQFLQTISSLELPSEVFKHHINTIGCLYKSSIKTAEVENFVLKGLLSCANLCEEDKNYGKFLLVFFQSISESNMPISRSTLQQLLDIHKTTFKRPCQTILDKIKSY